MIIHIRWTTPFSHEELHFDRRLSGSQSVAQCPEGIPVFVIDPKIPQQAHRMGYHLIEKGASEGVQELKNILLSETR